MKIQVTQDDIDEGHRANCYDCPVARAIKRVLKPGFIAQVGTTCITFVRVNFTDARAVSLPEVVSDFIKQFDRIRPPEPNMQVHNGRPVKYPFTVEGVRPFEFELDIPEMYIDAMSVAL